MLKQSMYLLYVINTCISYLIIYFNNNEKYNTIIEKYTQYKYLFFAICNSNHELIL